MNSEAENQIDVQNQFYKLEIEKLKKAKRNDKMRRK